MQNGYNINKFKNSKTSDPYKPYLSDKTNLKRSNKYVVSNLTICYTWKNSYKNRKSKISASTRNDKFEFLMDRILYLILKIILSKSLKNMKQ